MYFVARFPSMTKGEIVAIIVIDVKGCHIIPLQYMQPFQVIYVCVCVCVCVCV
jgi:hypothetical protein